MNYNFIMPHIKIYICFPIAGALQQCMPGFLGQSPLCWVGSPSLLLTGTQVTGQPSLGSSLAIVVLLTQHNSDMGKSVFGNKITSSWESRLQGTLQETCLNTKLRSPREAFLRVSTSETGNSGFQSKKPLPSFPRDQGAESDFCQSQNSMVFKPRVSGFRMLLCCCCFCFCFLYWGWNPRLFLHMEPPFPAFSILYFETGSW